MNYMWRMELPERRPIQKMTLWEAVKDFFNHHDINDITTRQDLLHDIRERGFDRAVDKALWGPSSINTYRNYLTKAGYLSHFHRNGMYRIEKTIPVDLTIEDVKHEAYGNRNGYYIQRWDKVGDYIINFPRINKKKEKHEDFITEEEFKV